jgi:hypothetical protein
MSIFARRLGRQEIDAVRAWQSRRLEYDFFISHPV